MNWELPWIITYSALSFAAGVLLGYMNMQVTFWQRGSIIAALGGLVLAIAATSSLARVGMPLMIALLLAHAELPMKGDRQWSDNSPGPRRNVRGRSGDNME